MDFNIHVGLCLSSNRIDPVLKLNVTNDSCWMWLAGRLSLQGWVCSGFK